MSHVATIELEIRDLACLIEAAKECGLEFLENQQSYRWYGVSVGDYPLPTGFRKSDLGKCDHALRVKNGNGSTYEIGVCARRDGKPGFTLLWDFWQGGYGLQAAVGTDGNKLKDAYAAAVATKELKRKGYRVQRTKNEAGKIILTATGGR